MPASRAAAQRSSSRTSRPDGTIREAGYSGHARRLSIVVAVLCVIALVPLLIVGIYDRPSVDDYTLALTTSHVWADTGSFLAVISAAAQTSADYMLEWQGLYTSTFFQALQPGIWGNGVYVITPYLMIVCLFFSVLFLSYCIEKHGLHVTPRHWITVGCLVSIFLLQCYPAINESIFWFNGAVNYTPFFCGALVTSGLCLMTLNSPRTVAPSAFVAGVLGFFTSGGNLMPAFFNLLLMFAFAVLGIVRKRRLLLVPFLLTAVGFVINVTAPGTALRRALYPDHPSALSTIIHSAWQNLLNMHAWVDLTFVLLVIVLAPIIATWAKRTDVKFTFGKLVIVTLGLFVVEMGVLSAPYYAAGWFGNGRMLDVEYAVFAIEAVFVCGYAICWLVQSCASFSAFDATPIERWLGSGPSMIIAGCAIAAFVLFGSSIVGHGNSYLAVYDLANGSAAEFARECDDRDNFLRAHTGESVDVRLIVSRPATLFFADIDQEDPEWWCSVLERYYDLQGVGVEGLTHS